MAVLSLEQNLLNHTKYFQLIQIGVITDGLSHAQNDISYILFNYKLK